MQNLVKRMMANNLVMEMRPCPEFRGIGVRFLKDGIPVVSRIIDTVIFRSEERVVEILEDMLDRFMEDCL